MVDTKDEPAGDGLPDGWSKEYRPRKVRAGARARRDLFYIDPTNSYEFRSLKDVHRHLESRDASNSAVTPNKRKVEDLRNSENQPHHAEGPSDNMQMDTAHESNPKSRENSEDMPSSELKGVSQGRLAELELQNARVNNQSPEHESTGRQEGNVEPKPNEKKQRTKPGKQISTPLRASPRLTALKANQELKLNQEASDEPRDSPISRRADIDDQLEPAKQVEKPKSKTMSSLLTQKNKDGAHCTRVSKCTEDKHPSAPEQTLGTSVACSITEVGYQNGPARVHAPPQQAGLFGTADAMPGSSLSSLLRSMLSDPCLEFAFKTLTDDIPVLDSNLPAPNYLNKVTDPCLEFAFKTLTGDIPVLENNLPAPNYFNKVTDPCLEFAFKTLTGDIPVLDNNLPATNYLNKGTGPPSCSSSTYDGARKNHAQVDRVRLSMPMPRPRPSDKLYSGGWFPPQ